MNDQRRVEGTAMLVRWWEGKPFVVIVPNGVIQIREEKAVGAVQMWRPAGPIGIRRLAKEEKQFLLQVGMHRGLFAANRVFAVSDEIAGNFDDRRRELLKTAAVCGLTKRDLSKIEWAKRRLRGLDPSSLPERRAVENLRQILTMEKSKLQPGRPGKVSAADRKQMHIDDDTLRDKGKSRDEIVAILAQRYELSLSYTQRILEDSDGETSD